MQVDALIYDPRARGALGAFFQESRRSHPRARLCFVKDWPDLMDRAKQRITDVAVVDPGDDGRRPRSLKRAAYLEGLLGQGRVILYVSPGNLQFLTQSNLREWGYGPMIVVGVDDDRTSLDGVFGGAAALVLHGRLEEDLRGKVPDVALDVFLAALACWTPGRNAAGLAKCFSVTEPDLRRLSKDLSLPTPREWLSWGRLYFGLGLSLIRGSTVSRLAYKLGYGDHASLCRLCRRLVGRKAQEVFGPEGEELTKAALMERLAG